MLSSFDVINSIRPANTLYSTSKKTAVNKTGSYKKYDSFSLSSSSGDEAIQKAMVSRLSNEVRTSTTIRDIQALKQMVASGEYEPDPMAIAGKMLYMMEGEE